MKEPWEETSAWKSKSAFFTWVRGNLRKALWQHFPTRNEYKKENTWSASNQEILDNKLSKRVKRVGRCELTGEIHAASNLQVDHIEPAGSLNSWEDLPVFIEKLLCSKENMRLVSKEAHKIHTYAEKHNMTFDQAKIEKEVIQFSKLTPEQQRAKLREHGVDEDSMSNQKKRKDVYREILGGNYED